MNSPQWRRYISCRPSGAQFPVSQESPPNVQNTKICWGFFRTGFRFSDRRKYFGSLFWDLGVTLLIIGGEGLTAVRLRHGWSSLIYSSFVEEELLSTAPCSANLQVIWSLWVGRWTDVCWIHGLYRLLSSHVLKWNMLLLIGDRVGPRLQACFFQHVLPRSNYLHNDQTQMTKYKVFQ